MFLLSSCEKESLEEAGTPVNLLSRTEAAAQQPHERAGAAFRQTMDTWLHTQPTTTEPITAGFSPANMSEPELLRFLAGYAEQGFIAAEETEAMQKLLDFFGKYPFRAETPLADIKADLTAFLNRENINSTRAPIAFNTALVVKEALFETQVSKLDAREEGTSSKGVNDGQLCRNTGWFCPDNDWQNIALTASASAAGSVFRDDVNWNGTLETAAAAVIAASIKFLYQSIFCTVECDECGPAAGVTRVFDGCDFEGIRAVGSFEFAERWIFKIDANMDGAIDDNIEVFENFASESLLPSSPFEAIVDVLCDGATLQAWPVDEQISVIISPNADATPLPTANLVQPPLNNGYYYLPNTQLCFSLNNLATQGNIFLRWEASGGAAIPMTSTSINTFCTTFSGPTLPSSVSAIFQDPCTGLNRYISTSFLICDTCN